MVSMTIHELRFYLSFYSDFSEAFDTVSHLAKIGEIGIGGNRFDSLKDSLNRKITLCEIRDHTV